METTAIFAGLINKDEIKVNGAALCEDDHPTNRIQLTAVKHASGSAWWSQSVDLTKDWVASFDITAFNGSGTSDGFAFVINGDPSGLNALGDGGQNLGFFGYDSKVGIGRSYAVIFDMWTTHSASLIGFAGSSVDLVPQGSAQSPVPLANNAYSAKISYSAALKSLSLSIADKTFKQDVDLQAVAGGRAYLGFTAASGTGTLDTDVSNWSVVASKYQPSPLVRGNSIYVVVDGPAWGQAEATAVELGGHLVTINDGFENSWIAHNCAAFEQQFDGSEKWLLNAWIGFSDAVTEGIWKWSSGQTATFTGWGPGEPSSGYSVPVDVPYELSDRTEDFAHIIVPAPGGFNEDFGVYWNSAYHRAHMLHGGSVPEINGIAEIPFVRRGDSAYVIVQGPTWDEAEANARKLGGHLVTINDEAENEWLIDALSGELNSGKESANWNGAWIGISQKNGQWSWSSGDSSDYLNWYRVGANGDKGKIYTLHNESEYTDAVGFWNSWAGSGLAGIAEIKLAPNSIPTGIPTITGTLKAGSTVTLDLSSIHDADNHAYWTPAYQYSWEIANDPGMLQVMPVWEALTTADATDGNKTLEITEDLTGKLIRGVVTYVDGCGTKEVVTSDASVKIEAEYKRPVVRGGSLYTIVDGPLWTQAEANAVKLGGHLAALSNKAEDDFVFNKFIRQAAPPSNYADHLWIGLSDSDQEGAYKWSSGEAFTYNNIDPINYVDVRAEDGQDWVLYWGQNGTWDTQELAGYPHTGRRGLAEIPFIRRGDSAYVIVQGPTWEEAEANAVQLGGHLVTINDAEENDWLASSFLNTHNWIGLKWNGADWSWADGDTLGYTKWIGGSNQNPVDLRTRGVLGNSSYWYENYGWAFNGIAEIKLAPNSKPTAAPVLSGIFKVGQTISIDKRPIQDADNFIGYTPDYYYSFEVSSDNGVTWSKLTSADAVDNNSLYALTSAEAGRQIRGVVSYLDAAGTHEFVGTAAVIVEALPPVARLVSLPMDLAAKVGQIIEIPIRIDQAKDLQSLDLAFAFDPKRFAIPASTGLVRPGSLTSDWTFVANVIASSNMLQISGFGVSPLGLGQGDLAILSLQVKGDAPRGSSSLDLLSASLNENEIAVDCRDGLLKITAPKLSVGAKLRAPLGGSIKVPIGIDDATGIQSLDLVFAYDSGLIALPASGELIDVGLATIGWSFVANTTTPGQIRISGFGTTPLSGGSAGLLALNLKVKAGVSIGTTDLDLVSASFNEGALSTDLVDGSLELLPPTFQVLGVRHTASGLALQLSEAPDLDRLNLYDGQDLSADQADLRLTRSDGTIVQNLSLHWQQDAGELHVIRTDSLTGLATAPFKSDLLPVGDYTLAIDSRSDGLISAAKAELIDGNRDGITGDSFSYAFSQAAPAHLIAIADTARGPGQSLSLNGTTLSSGLQGLPLLVSTTESLTQLQGTIRFDPAMLLNPTVRKGRDLPAEWSLDVQQSSAGVLTYTASGPTAITGANRELFRLDAVVSKAASYGSSTLVQATATAVNHPSLVFESEPSLILIAYPGDVTGNKSLSSLDASRLQRVVVGLDSGFDPYDQYAPNLVGDVSGNGSLSSLDASRLQQRVVGLDVTAFPVIPDVSVLA